MSDPSVGATPEQVLLAQRLFVAMVEARNIDGQKYSEFQYEPIRPEHAWAELFAVAAEANHWKTAAKGDQMISPQETRKLLQEAVSAVNRIEPVLGKKAAAAIRDEIYSAGVDYFEEGEGD